MKSGVPWQVKGVGRQAQETAREAARRSGLSVGEWLDNVILDSALHGGVEPNDLPHRRYDHPSSDAPEGDRNDDVPPRSTARPDYDDDRDIERRSAEPRSVEPRSVESRSIESRSIAWARYDRDFGGEPTPLARARYRDDAKQVEPDEGIRPRHRDEADDEHRRRPMFHEEPVRSFGPEPIRHRTVEMDQPRHTRSDDDPISAAEARDPFRVEARRRAEELAERLSVATVEERCKPAVDQGFADVKDRLDAMTQQLSQLADFNAAHARAHRPAPRDEETFAAVRSRLDAMTQQLSQLADLNAAQARAPRPSPRDEESLAEVRGRLDAMTQQLSQLADLNAAPAQQASRRDPRDEETARQLAAAISQLDRRLDQVIAEGRSAKSEIEQRVNAVDRAVAHLNHDRPRVVVTADPPTPLDQALLEIADRQRALDGYTPLPADGPHRTPASAEALPRPRTQELSGLEQQLRQINSRIEALAQPCGLDKAVETLRDDLAEIGVMLQEAMPRKAVEALEVEVRNLAERIDHSRHAGADGPALTGVEHGLAEVRDALYGLTPAESLVGIDRTVQELSQKVDLIAHSVQDPAALRQLESSIIAMRGLVSHVASNDALAKLSDEVRVLSDKVDQVAGSGSSNIVSALEERITMLADALEARNQRGQIVPHELETVVRGLTDKIERIQLTQGDHVALGHLEDRIVKLVEKLDASDARLNHLEAIERGLAELLIHLEHQRVPNLARAENSSQPPEMEALSRDVDGLREADKRTQDTLEAVHGTLGHVVDRLAMIENDLHSKHVSIGAPRLAVLPEAPAVAARNEPIEPIERAGPAAPAAAVSAHLPIAHLPIEAIEVEPPAPAAPLSAPLLQPPPIEPPPPSELAPASPIEPPAPIEFAPEPPPPPVAPAAPIAPAAVERRPIDPSLPPDHPLEPGLARGRYPGSPADRIAASEAALAGAKPPVIPDPGGKSNFIAAARRAAQAAGRDTPVKNAPSASPGDIVSAAGKLASRVGKLRMLIGGGAAVLLVFGSLQIARNLLGPSEEAVATLPDAPSQIAMSDTANLPTATVSASTPAAPNEPVVVAPAPSAPSIGRQSTLSPALDALTKAIPKPGNGAAPKAAAATPAEVTGSVPSAVSAARAQPPVAPAPVVAPAVAPVVAPVIAPVVAPVMAPTAPVASLPPATAPVAPAAASPADKLPAAFSHSLRAAAAKGDPAAQYEVATRYAEGRGAPQNLADAAEWFERAAKQGLAPAQFRLAGLYEKGLGVKKNLDIARRLYLTAGEAGHPKALHNLAVLYAEGIDGKPDYQTAARWFRKAADYGVTDSQFNLAVLYTRGIGVEQNLADAYKWFALAAREGDAEAARKRDEVGARLDQTALQAAALAARTWTAEPQPESAIQVKTPPGGWGEPTAAAAPPPPPAKRKPPAAAAPKLDIKLDLATPR